MPPLLQVLNLCLRLGGRQVLCDLSLDVVPGQVHALLGANGAGKSSLAYAIMGCANYVPDRGQILLEGEPINALPLHERARKGIALAWQEPARYEGLTIGDFLLTGLAQGEVPENCLAAVGLEPAAYLSRPLDRTLSGGERKRVELAGVMARQPRLAVLDEPTAGIDLLTLDTIETLIGTLKAKGAAVLLITHQEPVAARADTAAQLCGGRIVCQGEPSAVIANYKARLCTRCDGEICGHEQA